MTWIVGRKMINDCSVAVIIIETARDTIFTEENAEDKFKYGIYYYEP